MFLNKKGFVLLEKDRTKSWVLSPNSEINTNKKATKKGYKKFTQKFNSFGLYICKVKEFILKIMYENIIMKHIKIKILY